MQAAREAGVPEEQIQEMAALAMQGRTSMADVPKVPPRERNRKKNILSESEDDEVFPVEESGEPATGGEALTTAVQKLTEIAAHLTVEKKRGRTLDALLDGVGSAGGSETMMTTGSRKYSVALRALRRAVEKQPEELSRVLERNMETDFYKVSQIPGSNPVPVSARAWLELRSKVQGYQTPVRLLWGIAGILDALKANKVAEARCRAGLLLASGDQMSIDRGSWLVAGELMLEDPPPMAAFNAHVLPTESEPPYTRLVDSRWLELVLAKLSDIDSLHEKKKKLNVRRSLVHGDRKSRPPKRSPEERQQRRRERRQARWCEGHHPGDCLKKSFSAPASRDTAVGGGNTLDGRLSRAQPLGTVGSPLKSQPMVSSGVRKAPGADASTVCACQLWEAQIRWLLSSRGGRLRRFFHSTFSKQVGEANNTSSPRPVWPIPLPFWGKQSNLEKKERAFQAAVNAVVITLNWLHLDQPCRVPSGFQPRRRLTPEQHGIVQRLQRLMKEWAEADPITAEDMGRTAGKVETLEDTIALLSSRAQSVMLRIGSGGGPIPEETKVFGQPSTLLGEVQLAKELESHRLQFGGRPAFRPEALLSPTTRAVYEDPLAYARTPSELLMDPPHVQVRGRRQEALGLLKKLDQTDRLAIFRPEDVRMPFRAGLFALAKNTTVDRLIMDARPANMLEDNINEWTALMAAVTPMLDISLAPDDCLVMSGEDLRDYYYYYQVSASRAARNALAMELSEEEASKFSAFSDTTPGSLAYVPALKTMAMGDLNSVEFGQAAHTRLVLQSGVNMEDLLTLRGRLPRKPFYVGVVIDDFVAMEHTSNPLADGMLTTAIADKMVGCYDAVGLLAHDKKRFRQQVKAKSWGASIDGQAGTIRAQLVTNTSYGVHICSGGKARIRQPQVARSLSWCMDSHPPVSKEVHVFVGTLVPRNPTV